MKLLGIVEMSRKLSCRLGLHYSDILQKRSKKF